MITDCKIISLNSEDGIQRNDTFLSDMKFDLPNLISPNPEVVYRQISLLNAQLPFSFYNVNYNYNTLGLLFGITPISITIPVGNYNSTNLFTTLSANILSLTTYVVNFSISNITGCITISSTTNFSISSNSAMNKILGFKENTSYNSTLIGSIYTLTSPFPLNLLGTKKLQIRSTQLSMNNYSSNNGGLNTLLITIPVNASPFGMIDYTSVSNSLISFSNSSLDEIDISISDAEDNNLINFNNQHWTLTLAIYEYKQIIASPQPINNTTELLKQVPILEKQKPKQKSIDETQLEFLSQ